MGVLVARVADGGAHARLEHRRRVERDGAGRELRHGFTTGFCVFLQTAIDDRDLRQLRAIPDGHALPPIANRNQTALGMEGHHGEIGQGVIGAQAMSNGGPARSQNHQCGRIGATNNPRTVGKRRRTVPRERFAVNVFAEQPARSQLTSIRFPRPIPHSRDATPAGTKRATVRRPNDCMGPTPVRRQRSQNSVVKFLAFDPVPDAYGIVLVCGRLALKPPSALARILVDGGIRLGKVGNY